MQFWLAGCDSAGTRCAVPQAYHGASSGAADILWGRSSWPHQTEYCLLCSQGIDALCVCVCLWCCVCVFMMLCVCVCVRACTPFVCTMCFLACVSQCIFYLLDWRWDKRLKKRRKKNLISDLWQNELYDLFLSVSLSLHPLSLPPPPYPPPHLLTPHPHTSPPPLLLPPLVCFLFWHPSFQAGFYYQI